jgi:hypothetical protein
MIRRAGQLIFGGPNRRCRWPLLLAITFIIVTGCMLLLKIGLGVGSVWSHKSWPMELSDMTDSLTNGPKSVQFEGIHVYCLGAFIDAEFMWRANAPKEAFDFLVSKYQLTPITEADVPSRFWRRIPPWVWWWNPDTDATALYAMSPVFDSRSRGPDGLHMVALYDESNSLLFVWSKDNF